MSEMAFKHPSKDQHREANVSVELDLSELDITGAPLEYDLCYPQLDETIDENRNWRQEEESYSPLAISEARLALNYGRQYLSKHDWSAQLFAICDGKDNNRTILLGSSFENKWFTTFQVFVSDARLSSDIEQTPAALLNEYTQMYSVGKHKVCTAVNSTYELCGTKPGIVEPSDIASGCFSGTLNIEIKWNTLSFYAPIRKSTSTLIMELVAGCNESNLANSWSELALLDQYLNLLEQCKTNVQTPRTMTPLQPITWDKLEEKLDLLLNGEIENKYYNVENEDDHRDVMDQDKLKNIVCNFQSRPNMDYADTLWELLKNCAEYTQVNRCFRTILDEIQSGSAASQFTSTNSTRISDIISKIRNQEGVPLFDQDSPLELLIDTGLEKLSRDYTYILLSTNLIDLQDIRQTLCNVQDGVFNIEGYRKKLTSLAQIHVCLEFTLFAENYLDCPTANLRSIFSYAFRKYVSENSALKSYSDLRKNEVQCLKVPLPTLAVEHIAKGLPSSWCLTLSSESSISKIATTSYLSRTPIVPPNIYCFDDSKEHEVYHCLKLNVSSMKFA